MIAIARSPKRKACVTPPERQVPQLLPEIPEQANFAFRRLPVEAREELIQEVVAQAYSLFVRLCQRGKLASVYPTPLAQFAIKKVRAGRRIGLAAQQPGRHVTACPRDEADSGSSGSTGSISGPGSGARLWSRTARQARLQIAETRIDFDSWLSTLSNRDRQLAEKLALGETTGCVARMFRISAARVSQLRRDLCAKLAPVRGRAGGGQWRRRDVGRVLIDELASRPPRAVWPGRSKRGGFPDLS